MNHTNHGSDKAAAALILHNPHPIALPTHHVLCLCEPRGPACRSTVGADGALTRTNNWNRGRLRVDSLHPSAVESEYIEGVSEEIANMSVPDQDATVRIREYCERNFDIVVGTSFGFSEAFLHMSFEPVCHFWFNQTTGDVTSIPQTTYLLHASGNVQVISERDWYHPVSHLSVISAFRLSELKLDLLFTQTPTLATVFTKVYEMKYLAGVLVGNHLASQGSPNHLVGVVGSYPIAETFRHINSFIRGCVEADPLCRVAVIWSMSWDNEYTQRCAGMPHILLRLQGPKPKQPSS